MAIAIITSMKQRIDRALFLNNSLVKNDITSPGYRAGTSSKK